MHIQLQHVDAPQAASHEDMAKTVLARFGLVPRKKDGQAKMHQLLLELYERKKQANREKKPELAVMPVEHMASAASIKRQTMYDHLRRWLDLQLLKKTSFVSEGKVIVGYELNGTTLEHAFRRAETRIKNHLDESFKLIEELQKEIKKDKLRNQDQ